MNLTYSEEEQKWKRSHGKYNFQLSKDTDTLVEIGSKMNICVGATNS